MEGPQMIKFIIICSMLLLISIAVCGEVYMWTDANGVKRFSSSPVTSQSDTRELKPIGKETNYIAPTPTKQPPRPSDYDESKLTRQEKFILMESELPSLNQKMQKQITEKSVKEINQARKTGNQTDIPNRFSLRQGCN